MDYLTFLSHTIIGDIMRFRLGYVAISPTLDEIIHFRTLTYTSYNKLDIIDANKKLDNIILDNIETLKFILTYNLEHQIHFYRISHNIIPLATHKDVEFDYITPYLKKWKEVSSFIKKNKIRVDMHPDQFCVLNSIRPEIVSNSIEILNFNVKLFKALKIDGKAIIHVGSSVGGKEEAIKRFKDNFNKLDSDIKKMIILENDDKVFNIIDVLEICEDLKIPMVLDYHHYICNHGKEKLVNYLPRIYKTWEGTGLLPKIHFSSPKNMKEKRTHSTYIKFNKFITFLNLIKPFKQDVDIMLECKGKDEALFRLSRQLRTKDNIIMIDNSTFEI